MSTTSAEMASLALSVGVATAAGLVGCFAVMRRMTLAADAISHVALPGIGVALLLRINPLAGALATLLLGALLVWALETQTRIATETIVGVVFSVALAVGSLMASGEELIDALFGGPTSLSAPELVAGLLGAAAVIVFILKAKHRLVVSLISPEVAATSGIAVARLDLFFLLAFALTVALGLRYLGALLMGSLIIIPAATARRLAKSLGAMLWLSVVVAIASTVGGIYAGQVLGRATGPLIVALAGVIFFVSLLRPSPR